VVVEVRVMTGDVVVGREQEATSATCWVTDCLTWLRSRHVYNCPDQRSGREVLPCAPFSILSVLFEQSLIGVALHIGVKGHPLLAVNQVYNHAAELGWVLDLVLRLAEDDAEHTLFLAQFFKD